MIGSLFPYHDGGGIKVSIRNLRKNGTVGKAEVLNPDDPAFRIDNRIIVIGSAHTR